MHAFDPEADELLRTLDLYDEITRDTPPGFLEPETSTRVDSLPDYSPSKFEVPGDAIRCAIADAEAKRADMNSANTVARSQGRPAPHSPADLHAVRSRLSHLRSRLARLESTE